MTTTYTDAAGLDLPGHDDEDWDVPVLAMIAKLDNVSALANLFVTPTEFPSASLFVKVSAGTYQKADGTMGSYAGTASFAVPNNQTSYLWLTDAGALTLGTAWPATAHVRLSVVTTAAGVVTAYLDRKRNAGTVGTGLGFVLKAGDAMTGTLSVGTTLVVSPSAGTLGFFGATPATQATAVAALTDSTGGTASGTLAAVGSSYSQSVAANNTASLAAKVNALIAAMKRHGLMAGP